MEENRKLCKQSQQQYAKRRNANATEHDGNILNCGGKKMPKESSCSLVNSDRAKFAFFVKSQSETGL